MMSQLLPQLDRIMTTAITGSVAETIGMTISAAGFPAPVGAIAEIHRQNCAPLLAEVIGFHKELTLLYPLGNLVGIRHGNRVRLRQTTRWLRVGPGLLGRVLGASGDAVDGKPQPALAFRTPLERQPPHACTRPRIDRPLTTGIRAIDGLLTCGKGQRMGVFAGSGVGKSVLLGMMARYTSADVNVIALIGERGREVNEFIERDLGPQGLAKSVVVVATSDEPALVRVQAASAALSIAEYFRDSGKDVLLLMDSVTRFAMAQREIGLAAGEPPATRGYPPSVFALLPKLVERAGRTSAGSITAFFTVLVEGDDPNEPVADTVRGLLDGHTWLSRSLASRGHYPAIDILGSLSRLMSDLASEEQRRAATAVRSLLAAYRDHEDLISIGAYRRGGNKLVDVAIDMQDELNGFLRQRVDQASSVDDARQALLALQQKAQHLAGSTGGKA
jgi:flagellum-specific ATP synthase